MILELDLSSLSCVFFFMYQFKLVTVLYRVSHARKSGRQYLAGVVYISCQPMLP